ncbi:MAG: hypothetical protein R3D67_20120 [Hyphomicrobiaceae bacterium]
MRLITLCLSIGLASLAVPTAVIAADWNNGDGGMKDYRASGVPVPAPIPYAETFKWYLRADVGLGVTTEPSVKETGVAYGIYRDPADGPAFGSSPSWFTTDFDFFAQGGVGVGAYITPQLRADVTVDARTKSSINSDATYSYMVDPGAGNPATLRADGIVSDRTDVRSTVMLANVYWDIGGRGSAFMPYVGVGVGAAVRTMERDYSAGERLYDTTTVPETYSGSGVRYFGHGKAHQLAPAVAVTAGLGYALSSGMVLDLNYRYTYIGAADFGSSVNFSPANPSGVSTAVSRMTVGDTQEHALRAGVRWNVW